MIGTLHIVIAMKPLDGNFVANAKKYGVAGLNIDGCRISTSEILKAGSGGLLSNVRDQKEYPEEHGFKQAAGGRWPANVILDVVMAKAMDGQSGITRSGAMKREVVAYEGDSVTHFLRGRSGPSNQHGDCGGVSRFFKVFKGE